MALVDVDYNFKFVDIGCNGRIRDGGLFNGCSLARVVSRVARPETGTIFASILFDFVCVSNEKVSPNK